MSPERESLPFDRMQNTPTPWPQECSLTRRRDDFSRTPIEIGKTDEMTGELTETKPAPRRTVGHNPAGHFRAGAPGGRRGSVVSVTGPFLGCTATMPSAPLILVLNAGSSSLKFARNRWSLRRSAASSRLSSLFRFSGTAASVVRRARCTRRRRRWDSPTNPGGWWRPLGGSSPAQGPRT